MKMKFFSLIAIVALMTNESQQFYHPDANHDDPSVPEVADASLLCKVRSTGEDHLGRGALLASASILTFNREIKILCKNMKVSKIPILFLIITNHALTFQVLSRGVPDGNTGDDDLHVLRQDAWLDLGRLRLPFNLFIHLLIRIP